MSDIIGLLLILVGLAPIVVYEIGRYYGGDSKGGSSLKTNLGETDE